MRIKLNREQANEIAREEYLELDGYFYSWEDSGPEIINGEYTHWETIYVRDDGKFFKQYNYKADGCYSDYDFFCGEELIECKPETVTKLVWKEVPNE